MISPIFAEWQLRVVLLPTVDGTPTTKNAIYSKPPKKEMGSISSAIGDISKADARPSAYGGRERERHIDQFRDVPPTVILEQTDSVSPSHRWDLMGADRMEIESVHCGTAQAIPRFSRGPRKNRTQEKAAKRHHVVIGTSKPVA